MSVWTVASAAFLLTLVPSAVAALRGDPLDRLIGMQLAGTIAPLACVAIAMASGRVVYLEVGLSMALLSTAGGLAYARFLERWL